MRKPRMTKTEKRFSEMLTTFLFTVPNGQGQFRMDKEKWKMLDSETQSAYLNLISSKTR